MEFIGTAILMTAILVLTVTLSGVVLIIVSMCLPLLGIRSLPGEPDYDPGKKWLNAGPRP